MALSRWPRAAAGRHALPKAVSLPPRWRHCSAKGDSFADIEAMLAKPSWSVRSLFPKDSPTSQAPPISQKRLHHLLRLSALPLPISEVQEKNMISDLQSQLRFVQAIQSVDTEDVEPLVALRDETVEAEKENEITLETLKGEFAKEEVVGVRGRIRRRRDAPEVERNGEEESEGRDLLSQAGKRVGKWVVVDTAKD